MVHFSLRTCRMRSRSRWFVVAIGLMAPVVGAPGGTDSTRAADPPTWGCTPPAQPGEPRPWEAGIDVSTYCTANAVNRNLFTEIPLVGWSGVGPAMQMTLFHNSAAVGSLLPLYAGMGFDLGKGWRTSYSAQIINLAGGDRLVVHDDGTWDRHRYYNGTLWIPPAGVFEVLQKTNPITWRLTFKDQSYREFDSFGRLTRVVDAVGNVLTITRVMVEEAFVEHMAFVTDASDRQLQFEYDPLEPTRLVSILDNSWDVGERRYQFEYDSYDRLSKIIFPINLNPTLGAEIQIAYDAGGRITSITDKRNPNANPAEPTNTYTFAYDGNQIATVTDPTPQTGSPLTQVLATTCAGGIFMPDVFTAYTDRRGAEWVYHSVRPNPETSPETGPLGGIQNPLGHIQTYVHNINRLLVSYRDALSHGWDYGYDAQGNRNLATDPLNAARTHQWTYDAYNNVKTYTDPLGNVTSYRYHYEDVSDGYKTLVTKVTEPPDGQGNPAADTVMEYYLATPPIDCGNNPNTDHCKHGLLKKATDPNGVVTAFDYDGFGQQSKYEEGVAPNQSGLCHLLITRLKDSRGRAKVTCFERSACFGMQTQQTCFDSGHNLANQQSSGGCAIPDLARPEPPGSLPPLLQAFPKTACAARALPSFGGTWSATYAGNGTVKEMAREVIMAEGQTVLEDSLRTSSSQYDELSAPTVASVESDEYAGGTPQTRQFIYAYDRAGGNYTRFGPDSMRTIGQDDVAGRVQSLVRGPAVGSANMTAAYTYFVDDRLDTVTLGNGAAVAYSYDTAGRVSTIQHLRPSYELTITYAYDARDLPIGMTETSSFLGSATVSYGYDNRGRLIHEARTGDTPYDLTYTYDQGGNRRQKIDAVNQRRTEYDYDVENPAGYGSNGNRLMKAHVFDTSPEPDVLVSTTWYFYNAYGNVERVVTNQAGSDLYSGVRFGYTVDKQTVIFALAESWRWDGVSTCEVTGSYDITFARHYRYDTGRARYLERWLDLAALETSGQIVDVGSYWTDYDEDTAYGEFTTASNPPYSIVNLRAFEPGVAEVDPWTSSGGANTHYYHNDHLGTTRLMSGATWPPFDSRRVFNAFGERLAGPTPLERFGYAGAWGYQQHADFPFLHVGARYYDPSSGRFLQRDPIGIFGERNVYLYTEGNPVDGADPNGFRKVKTPHGWRNPANGRWARTPWRRRATKWGLKRVPIYWVSSCVARAGHRVAGKPYEDPLDVLLDTATNLLEYAGNEVDNWFRTPSPRPNPSSPGPQPSRDRDPCSTYCFVGTTPVLTNHGLLSISELHAGDRVEAADQEAGIEGSSTILHISVSVTNEVVSVELDGDELLVTAEHPFWVNRRGWIPAIRLTIGDILVTADGEDVVVRSVELRRLPRAVEVFNIVVDDLHAFFVGRLRILVHNKSC